jgi:hypothetical protein
LKTKRIPKNYQPWELSKFKSRTALQFSVFAELFGTATNLAGLVTKRYAPRHTERNVILDKRLIHKTLKFAFRTPRKEVLTVDPAVNQKT